MNMNYKLNEFLIYSCKCQNSKIFNVKQIIFLKIPKNNIYKYNNIPKNVISDLGMNAQSLYLSLFCTSMRCLHFFSPLSKIYEFL